MGHLKKFIFSLFCTFFTSKNTAALLGLEEGARVGPYITVEERVSLWGRGIGRGHVIRGRKPTGPGLLSNILLESGCEASVALALLVPSDILT